MLRVDTSDWNNLVKKYEARIKNLETNPFGSYRAEVHTDIKDLFRELLEMHEGVSLPEQLRYYKETGKGYYGSGWVGHDVKKINPQEWIGGASQSHIKGHGSFFQSSLVRESAGSGTMSFSLETGATMQPYPQDKETGAYLLPELPIMEYFRKGWKNRQNPNHHMKKRPFGTWLARSAGRLGRRLLAQFNTKLLRAAGFQGG